ncbi:Uncharacterised protein [Bordetella pertussis]|nr:Uncharacterised protein [Bordetella pertussis]
MSRSTREVRRYQSCACAAAPSPAPRSNWYS